WARPDGVPRGPHGPLTAAAPRETPDRRKPARRRRPPAGFRRLDRDRVRRYLNTACSFPRPGGAPGQERGAAMRLESAAAIITGGASGLGAATAEAFRQRGASVTVFDRAAEGEAGAQEIGAHFAAVDVTDEASVAAGIASARAAMGRIDVLVNCAGIATGERILGREGPHALASFRRTLDINLTGTFNVMRLAAAEMARNDGPERGVMVNTASIAAFDGQKGQAAYAASKGGIVGLTLPAARDLASLGIRVCAIAPGIFAT